MPALLASIAKRRRPYPAPAQETSGSCLVHEGSVKPLTCPTAHTAICLRRALLLRQRRMPAPPPLPAAHARATLGAGRVGVTHPCAPCTHAAIVHLQRSGSNCSRTRRPRQPAAARRTRLPPRAAWRPLDLCVLGNLENLGKHHEQAPPMAGRWRGSVVRRSRLRRAVWSCWRRQHRRARPCPVHSRRGGALEARAGACPVQARQCATAKRRPTELYSQTAHHTERVATSHREQLARHRCTTLGSLMYRGRFNSGGHLCHCD